MFLEDQLKNEFRKKADTIKSPKQLDQHIASLFHSYHEKRPRKDHSFSLKVPRYALYALIFVVLAGFGYATSKLLFETKSNTLNLEVRQDTTLKMETISKDQVRNDIAMVKENLVPGEAALIYFADFENEAHPFFKEMPGMIVSKPIKVHAYEQGLKMLDSLFHSYKKPKMKIDNYAFTNAFAGFPLDGGLTSDMINRLDKLKQEAKDTRKHVIWEKLDEIPQILPAITLTYKNDKENKIYLTLKKINGNTKLETTIDEDSSFEKLMVHNQKAYFIKNTDQFLSSTGEYEEILWIEQSGKETIIYSIASDSLEVTKEDLLMMANNMN